MVEINLPRITVAAVIEKKGRFLLVEEHIQGQRLFNQPAGHLELNESLIEAVQREVKEETCRLFEPQSLVGIYQFKQFIRFCFSGTVSEPLKDCCLDPDIQSAQWFELAQIKKLNQRSPMVLRCIEDYLYRTHLNLDDFNLVQIKGGKTAFKSN